MTIEQYLAGVQETKFGQDMYAFAEGLFPICRSITGDGLRETLRAVARRIDLKIHEVPTGTQVFDWTVPKEWNIRDAWIARADGTRVVDFRASNLHVVNYSVPVRKVLPLSELRPHLHSIPTRPDWIPYRTSYYAPEWGFCLTHRQLEALPDERYEVCIDSSLEDGHLTYGECLIPGATEDEILVSCHACHPSLCNDNLSGVSLVTKIGEVLSTLERRYSYRLLFVPGTIGPITWLARNEQGASRIRHGLVAACVGDAGPLHYKRSRRGDAEIDRAAALMLRDKAGAAIEAFSPYGYDERQYCSPGFNLAVGSLTRTPHGRYPEYHTSADNLDLLRAESLSDSFLAYLQIFAILERNATFRNMNPKCEPQLGRRGLYSATGGLRDAKATEMAMLWVLNLSDETHSLLDIAERSGLAFDAVSAAAKVLEEHDLLRRVDRL
jgi:aminopeptidase-like protein